MQLAPLRAAEGALEDPARLLEKSRRKNGVYKVLGESKQDSTVTQSASIYEETELLQELGRERAEKGLNSGLLGNKSSTYVHPYEEQRKFRKAEKAALGKRVTKDRAIKFVEHEKLVGFMSAAPNPYLLESRDDIINSLFGIRQKSKAQPLPGEAPKKLLKTAHSRINPDGEDDIQLF